METLDMLANNIANVSSAGFKGDSEFYSLYHAESAALDPDAPAPAESPVIEKQWTDFSQGQITATANDLDLALSGEGFFVVQSRSGTSYTRNGAFHVATNGTLQSQEGYTVLGADDKPVQVDGNTAVEVTSSGEVRQNGSQVGQLKLVKFATSGALTKQEHAYFRLSVSELKPVAATGVEVRQKSLERANVEPAQAAVRLVSVMRQFEMLQRAAAIGNEMNKHAIEDVARVSE